MKSKWYVNFLLVLEDGNWEVTLMVEDTRPDKVVSKALAILARDWNVDTMRELKFKSKEKVV